MRYASVGMPNHVFERIQIDGLSLYLMVYNTRPPAPDEEGPFLTTLASEPSLDKVRALVLTDGGTPAADSRRALQKFLAGRSIKVGIVTTNPFVRGIVTAISWFNPGNRAFKPSEVGRALTYLNVDAAWHAQLFGRIGELAAAVGGGKIFDQVSAARAPSQPSARV